MSSRETSARWSVFDGANFFQAKPDALMVDINTAIAAIEYARATALLNFSPSSSPSSTKNKSPDNNTASMSDPSSPSSTKNKSPDKNSATMYDPCISEESYRAGCTTMAAGIDLDSISPGDLHACS